MLNSQEKAQIKKKNYEKEIEELQNMKRFIISSILMFTIIVVYPLLMMTFCSKGQEG